jgi:hypothetical protein
MMSPLLLRCNGDRPWMFPIQAKGVLARYFGYIKRLCPQVRLIRQPPGVGFLSTQLPQLA